MKEYVLDANAIITFLEDRPGADKIDRLINLASQRGARLSISVINRGEAIYSLARSRGFEQALKDVEKLGRILQSISAGIEQSNEAARLHLLYKLGLGDCYAASLAMQMNATLVTADPEFARLGKKLKLMALPRHSV